jgi:Flp pilus assembly protein CpaB
LKRSNRLVLLIGVFLAIVAFVGILLLVRDDGSGPRQTEVPTTGPVVIAASDIPLSTRIEADQVTTKTVELTAISPGAFTEVSQVIGQIARQPVATGAQITSTTLSGGFTGAIIDVQVPVGQRAIAVRVDQISGVGTIIKTGDYVDAIIGLTEEQFVSIKGADTGDQAIVEAPGPKGATTKVLLQGMQVLGALLPPVPPPAEEAPAASGAPTTAPGTTTLNEQQEIVILSVTAQQAEVIRYAQLQANPLLTLSLVLRSTDDFIDPTTGQPATPVLADTTGVTLKILLDQYGVLPPVIQGPVLPNNRLPTPVRPVNP